jgi:hypothetical protein
MPSSHLSVSVNVCVSRGFYRSEFLDPISVRTSHFLHARYMSLLPHISMFNLHDDDDDDDDDNNNNRLIV